MTVSPMASCTSPCPRSCSAIPSSCRGSMSSMLPHTAQRQQPAVSYAHACTRLESVWGERGGGFTAPRRRPSSPSMCCRRGCSGADRACRSHFPPPAATAQPSWTGLTRSAMPPTPPFLKTPPANNRTAYPGVYVWIAQWMCSTSRVRHGVRPPKWGGASSWVLSRSGRRTRRRRQTGARACAA